MLTSKCTDFTEYFSAINTETVSYNSAKGDDGKNHGSIDVAITRRWRIFFSYHSSEFGLVL